MSFKEFQEQMASVNLNHRHILKLRSLLFDYFLSAPGSKGLGRLTMAELAKDVEIYAETKIDEETIRRFTLGYIWDREDRNVSRRTIDAVLRFCINCDDIRLDRATFLAQYEREVDFNGWPTALMRAHDPEPILFPESLLGHFMYRSSDTEFVVDCLLHIEPSRSEIVEEEGCFVPRQRS